MSTRLKVVTRTGKGVHTPADDLLEGFPLVGSVSSITFSTSPGSSLPSSSPQLSSSPSSPSPTSTGNSISIALTSTFFITVTPTASSSIVSDTKTFPSSTTIPPSVSISNTESISHNKNAIIRGVVGGVVGLLIMTALITYYLIRRSRRGKKHYLAHITAFKVSPDESIELTSQPKLRVDRHPSAPNPEVQTTNLPFVSDSNVTYPLIPSDAPRRIDESINQSSPDTAMPHRDPQVDQSMSHPGRALPGRIQPTLPIISHNHNSSSLNPLLRDILSATQGRNPSSSDPGDPNVPQNIHIFIINQPSNTDASGINEDGENRGDHYDRYLPHNMDSDTLSPPPSYE